MKNNLDHLKRLFNSVGWFIPPYVTLGLLSELAKIIHESNGNFEQQKLEEFLAIVYSPEHLAAMVISRYSITPVINEYKETIAEAIEAHFLGLNHVAVGGLLPVIEGISLKLAEVRAVKVRKRSTSFQKLAEHCKNDVIKNKIGAVGEVVSMIDSFIEYTERHLYADTDVYSSSDNTNRNGILHGLYTDKEYGNPINFYKVIAAVNFLCFVVAIRASISCLSPSPTDKSGDLAKYYRVCTILSKNRPACS